jgi:cobalt-zinc-cadmium efflux system outer membrane protein
MRIKFACLLGLPIVLALPALAEPVLSYGQFLKRVQDQNLELKLEAAKTDEAHGNANGILIPPPVVGLMRMKDQSGSTAGGFEVDQVIPFPTKLFRNSSAREHEAKAQEESQLGAVSQIYARARVIYFNAWASQSRQSILREKKIIVQEHIKLSRAEVRSDSFLKVHLLKAESDLDLLENDILAATQEIKEKQFALAEFLNEDASTFNPTLEEPPVSPMPEKANFGNSHQLEAKRLIVEGLKMRESEAKSAWIPDFYFRYKEIGQTALSAQYSETMFGISVPFLFPWEPASGVKKAAALRFQGEIAYETEKRRIITERELFFERASSLRKQLENITKNVLPKAESRVRMVHNLAPRDMETLQDHRETMEAFPDLKLKSIELRVRYEETIGEIEKYEMNREHRG